VQRILIVVVRPSDQWTKV